MIRRQNPARILPCQILSTYLEDSYLELVENYKKLGYTSTYFNALKAALAYLRNNPPICELRPGIWFVGDSGNRARIAKGEQPFGYECQPRINRCACYTTHPYKIGKVLPTCAEQQVVILYQHARLLESIHESNHVYRDRRGVGQLSGAY